MIVIGGVFAKDSVLPDQTDTLVSYEFLSNEVTEKDFDIYFGDIVESLPIRIQVLLAGKGNPGKVKLAIEYSISGKLFPTLISVVEIEGGYKCQTETFDNAILGYTKKFDSANGICGGGINARVIRIIDNYPETIFLMGIDVALGEI